jgi:hypothetical protein
MSSKNQPLRDSKLTEADLNFWFNVVKYLDQTNCDHCFMFDYCRDRDEDQTHPEGICDFIFMELLGTASPTLLKDTLLETKESLEKFNRENR